MDTLDGLGHGSNLELIEKAENGKNIKAGVNDRAWRSKGERKAYASQSMKPYVAGMAGGAAGLGGALVAARRGKKKLAVASLGAGLAADATGSVTSMARGHRAANEWRRKEGLDARGWWSGKPDPKHNAKYAKSASGRLVPTISKAQPSGGRKMSTADWESTGAYAGVGGAVGAAGLAAGQRSKRKANAQSAAYHQGAAQTHNRNALVYSAKAKKAPNRPTATRNRAMADFYAEERDASAGRSRVHSEAARKAGRRGKLGAVAAGALALGSAAAGADAVRRYRRDA